MAYLRMSLVATPLWPKPWLINKLECGKEALDEDSLFRFFSSHHISWLVHVCATRSIVQAVRMSAREERMLDGFDRRLTGHHRDLPPMAERLIVALDVPKIKE